ncbi:hypothetical protein VOLCADRAFT_104694 [Volvox carteri f. nagariensis]|uniref:protein-tyrosine-phosphatase n=1 Tax=Volvox carteri f. nagariensis TaxID=3068 RepID=D8TV47_VOLCA|nr:uncharacterized protein VOLCADRAFT_104694 [Volvox carteri f. nagariensis]EFJ48513.1 hypothetical protein VOLCADRAFT_104694 [Volvox carteri f. nagariensis]|eukprot:XP_002950312.1 hypothetical protein VOLCADRAFT_104694 [Volvox carteri f. nagariensis]
MRRYLESEISKALNPNAAPKTVTSESHPLNVSWIEPCQIAAGGRLGLTSCPGKHISARDGTLYRRDLHADLARLRQVHGVHAVVCLLPEAELRYLKVRNYAAAVEKHDMEYLQLPIIEMTAPSDLLLAISLVEAVAAHLQAGRTVIMHCKCGVGRAGLMAACVLLRLGVCSSAAEAIATVRRHRRGAVESRRQEAFVATYCGALGGSGLDGGGGGDLDAKGGLGADVAPPPVSISEGFVRQRSLPGVVASSGVATSVEPTEALATATEGMHGGDG